MSAVIADLIRLGLGRRGFEVTVTKRGTPQVSIGRSVTAEDVRSLDDEGCRVPQWRCSKQ